MLNIEWYSIGPRVAHHVNSSLRDSTSIRWQFHCWFLTDDIEKNKKTERLVWQRHDQFGDLKSTLLRYWMRGWFIHRINNAPQTRLLRCDINSVQYGSPCYWTSRLVCNEGKDFQRTLHKIPLQLALIISVDYFLYCVFFFSSLSLSLSIFLSSAWRAVQIGGFGPYPSYPLYPPYPYIKDERAESREWFGFRLLLCCSVLPLSFSYSLRLCFLYWLIANLSEFRMWEFSSSMGAFLAPQTPPPLPLVSLSLAGCYSESFHPFVHY